MDRASGLCAGILRMSNVMSEFEIELVSKLGVSVIGATVQHPSLFFRGQSVEIDSLRLRLSLLSDDGLWQPILGLLGKVCPGNRHPLEGPTHLGVGHGQRHFRALSSIVPVRFRRH